MGNEKSLAEICGLNGKTTESVIDKWSKHNKSFEAHLEACVSLGSVVSYTHKRYDGMPSECYFILVKDKSAEEDIYKTWKAIAEVCELSLEEQCSVGDFVFPYTSTDFNQLKSIEGGLDLGQVF